MYYTCFLTLKLLLLGENNNNTQQVMWTAKGKGRFKIEIKLSFLSFFRKNAIDIKRQNSELTGMGATKTSLCQVCFTRFTRKTPTSFLFLFLIKEEVLCSKEAMRMLLAEAQI